MIRMRQCRFISCNKSAFLEGDIDTWCEAMLVSRQGGGKLFVLYFHFFCEPKKYSTKIKFIKKIKRRDSSSGNRKKFSFI